MEPNGPRKIQFTVPLLEPHLDPEAAEQIRRRRPTPASLVLSSDQSSPEIDEDRLPNALLKVSDDLRCPQNPEVSPYHITPPSACFAVGSGHVPPAEEEGVLHHPHCERYLR
uniref:Protein phosphatase 1 regulatory subunit 1A n=1 Tax=Phasianus colchicus TaxID=9054 RepID=A0A669QB21_PHACC